MEIEGLRRFFAEGGAHFAIRYRRRYGEGFCSVLLEIIPASDYADDNQSAFLYVKILDV